MARPSVEFRFLEWIETVRVAGRAVHVREQVGGTRFLQGARLDRPQCMGRKDTSSLSIIGQRFLPSVARRLGARCLRGRDVTW